MHRSIHRTITVLFLAAGVAGVAACSGGPEPAGLTAESTAAGAGAISGTPASVATRGTASEPRRSESVDVPVFGRPGDAAAHVIAAWHAGDEASAGLAADPVAVEALFDIPTGRYGGSECREIAANHHCYFEGDGQSLELHVRNDRVQGHRVASVALLAHGSDVEAPPAVEDAAVLALQERLESLGFWLGDPDGEQGNLTTQAVMAFQKANRLQPDGKAGPATLDALAAASRPIPERMVDGIEIDLDRQLLFVIADGGVRWVLNTSTGAVDTPTARGDFTIDRHVDGVRHAPLGSLYRPAYFDGGTAIHGAASVPAYPASHGCARVSDAAMDMLWASSLVELGTPVRVV